MLVILWLQNRKMIEINKKKDYLHVQVRERAIFIFRIFSVRMYFRVSNLSKTDSSAYKSRLVHRTKVNEFFSRQETRVKERLRFS
jgi:hypothetical protein